MPVVDCRILCHEFLHLYCKLISRPDFFRPVDQFSDSGRPMKKVRIDKNGTIDYHEFINAVMDTFDIIERATESLFLSDAAALKAIIEAQPAESLKTVVANLEFIQLLKDHNIKRIPRSASEINDMIKEIIDSENASELISQIMGFF